MLIIAERRDLRVEPTSRAKYDSWCARRCEKGSAKCTPLEKGQSMEDEDQTRHGANGADIFEEQVNAKQKEVTTM